MYKESKLDHYDVIVVGGGLGGLTAAAWLAKGGKKVLLLEKEMRVGGYLGPLMHGSHYFNNGPRVLMGCNTDGIHGPGVTYSLLESLGVHRQCEFIPLQPFTTIRLPDLTYSLWSGRQAFIEGLRSLLPSGFENLPQLLDLCGDIHQAGIAYYKAKTPWGLAKMIPQLAGTLPYQNATVEQVLRRYIPQAHARNLTSILWTYLALPPQQASFIYWAMLMSSYIDGGAHFCKGGLHQLPQAVASAFQRDGGKLLAGAAAHRVMVQDRVVRGVELANGQRFFAPAVIANIDPRHVFGELIEPEQRPYSYLRKLSQMELSIRGINLLLVTDLDLPRLGFGYETLVLDSLEANQAKLFSLTIMNAADPGLAPPGQHLVSIYSGLPPTYNASPANDQRAATELFERVDGLLPNLKDHLLMAQTGEVPEGFLTHIYEPIYGWASLPRHSGLRRLSPHTPVRGLTLTGQWTRPGQGTTGVILSGLDAAERLLR